MEKQIGFRMSVINKDFSDSTSLFVYCLDPGLNEGRVPDKTLELLKKKGFARLYQIFLFSQNNEMSELSDERLKIWLGGIRKIFINIGDPGTERRQEVRERIEYEKNRIRKIAPDVKFYRFGELTGSGFSKKLIEIDENDKIYEI